MPKVVGGIWEQTGSEGCRQANASKPRSHGTRDALIGSTCVRIKSEEEVNVNKAAINSIARFTSVNTLIIRTRIEEKAAHVREMDQSREDINPKFMGLDRDFVNRWISSRR